MSRLLIDEHPLQVLPSLACKIGLNEAIFLQQLHYWLTKSDHNIEDKKWIYNSIESWISQFPFWGKNTIRRTIESLEAQDLIIIGNYNKLKIDRTKWYTINYSALDALDQATVPFAQNGQMVYPEWADGLPNMGKPLPETTTETTPEKKEKHNAALHPQCGGREEVHEVIGFYFKAYRHYLEKEHPKLKPEQLRKVYQAIDAADLELCLEYAGWVAMINNHFKDSALKTDYNINHFATEGVMQNLMYKSAY